MLGEDIEETAWIYALAAHEYYGEYEYYEEARAILTDQEYDALTRILVHCWPMIPKELKNIFGSPSEIETTGMHLILNAEQLKKARSVYNNYLRKKGR